MPCPPGNLTRPGDALVVFGITGDLARKMTFRSLYRLERRGLLGCPGDRGGRRGLVRRAAARACPPGDPGHRRADRRRRLRRLAKRLSYVSGDFGDAATYQAVARALGDAANPVFYLEIPPSLFATVVAGLADGRAGAGRPAGRRREAVRPRPGLGARARRRSAQAPRRGPAVPDRPLPGQDGARGDPVPALRQRDPRAGVESQLRRRRADHDGRELRRPGPRPFL